MPAKKPLALHTRHATQAEKDARVTAEKAMTGDRGLPITPPARLAKHETAAAVWRRLMRLYGELEAELVTRLDQDLLCDYCILMEQVTELDQLRRDAYEIYEAMRAAWAELPEGTPPAEKLDLAMKLQTAFGEVIKLDGRVDRKRALLLQLRQSLYLTPRARAGVAPSKKEEEAPVDPLEQLLDNVTTFVNSDGKQ
jgi:phage terminase small subunit